MPQYQIRVVETREQWIEVDAPDAQLAQQQAIQQPITAEAQRQCYAVRLNTDLTDKTT
jgi:hypothetical protein